IVARIEQFGFADRCQHSFGGTGVSERIACAQLKVFLQGHFVLARFFISGGKMVEYFHGAGPRRTFQFELLESVAIARVANRSYACEMLAREKITLRKTLARFLRNQ